MVAAAVLNYPDKKTALTEGQFFENLLKRMIS
jgi:hypothetical protein